MAEYRELNFSAIKKELEEDNDVYLIPRSESPTDYAIVTRLNQSEILKKGLEGELVFHAYEPICDTVEREVKDYLRSIFEAQRKENKMARRIIRSLCIVAPMVAAFNFLTGFFDDIVIDTIVIGTLIHTIYSSKKEKKNIESVYQKIENIKFVHNPLLENAFTAFKNLPTDKFSLIDLEQIANRMSEKELSNTINALKWYLGKLKKKTPIFKRILSLFKKEPAKEITLEPACRALYEDLLRQYEIAQYAPTKKNKLQDEFLNNFRNNGQMGRGSDESHLLSGQ